MDPLGVYALVKVVKIQEKIPAKESCKSLQAGFVSADVAQSCTEYLRRNKYQYMLKDKV